MNSRSKVVSLSLSLAAFSVLGLSVGALSAAPPVVPVPPPAPQAAGSLSCAGERMLRVEVERVKDLSVSMSKPVGAPSWLTELNLTGKIMITNGRKPCGTTSMRIVAEDPDAREALQTCAKIGSSIGTGQRLYVNLASAEGARSAAGNALVYGKPTEITCGIE